MSNTPVMDSPEVLGHALCRHVPDMRKGFTIQTRHGDIYVTADDAAPFAGAMERLLMRKISLIQDEQLGQDSDTSRVPLYTPKGAAQLERNLATIEENNQRILALEPVLTQNLHFSITEEARQNLLQNIRVLGTQTEQILKEATREDGKCLLSREDAIHVLRQSHFARTLGEDSREYNAVLQELVKHQDAAEESILSCDEKATLAIQIERVKDIAEREKADATSKALGMSWLIDVLIMRDRGLIPADNVLNEIKAQLHLPTPISPSWMKLCELQKILFLGRKPKKAPTPEADK